jgi:hypothetical protein
MKATKDFQKPRFSFLFLAVNFTGSLAGTKAGVLCTLATAAALGRSDIMAWFVATAGVDGFERLFACF